MRYLLSLLLLVSTAFADEAAVKALNPTAWWKSYKGLTVGSATLPYGMAISSVADQSGNSRTATQAGVAALRPWVTRADNRENRAPGSESWGDANYYTPSGASMSGTTMTATAGNVAHNNVAIFYPNYEPAGYVGVLVFDIAYNNYTYAAMGNGQDGAWHSAVVNLDTGAITTCANAASTTCAIETIGTKRYRVTITETIQAAGGNSRPFVTLAKDDVSYRSDTAWNAAGTEKLDIYSVQTRSTLADSAYVKTTTSAMYRGVCNTAGNHCLPAIRFDGVDDYFTSTATLANVHANNAKTLYALVRPAVVGANKDVIRFSSTQSDWGLQLVASGNWQIQNWDTNSDVAIRPSVVNELALIRARHDGGNIYISVNGVESAATASGNTGTMTATPFVGSATAGANFFNGEMVELILFNTALSPADQAIVEAYLNGVMSASADPWKRVSVLP